MRRVLSTGALALASAVACLACSPSGTSGAPTDGGAPSADGSAGGASGAGGTTGAAGAASAGGHAGVANGAGGKAVTAPPHDAGPPTPANDAVAPPSAWINRTGELATQAAGGGDLTLVSAVPGSSRVIAGVAKKGLWVLDAANPGSTWTHLGTGAGSYTIDNGPTALVHDPGHPGTFWESGIYGSGIAKTTDDGQTFTQLGTITHNDLVSVGFDDAARMTLLAGAHETPRKLFLSRDGGATWNDIGQNLPADSNFSSAPLVLDSQTFLLGSSGYGSGRSGVYRSVDGGARWTSASAEAPVGRPLWASNGSLYWPLIYDGGMIMSTDAGESWTKTGAGPVQPYSGSPAELPDGRVVALGKTHLLGTADGGKTWKEIGEPLPFPGANCGTYGFTYSARAKTFFINHNDCKGVILTNAVYSAGFDYTKE